MQTSLAIPQNRKLGATDVAATGLAIVGALNWGLVGLFRKNLVEGVFGRGRASRIVYSAVGVAGAYAIWSALKAAGTTRAPRPIV